MSEREFVGARLELARSFHGLTLKALAEKVYVSIALLGYYENGRRKQPSDDLVAALARVLKVQPGFFYEPVVDSWGETECSFRKRIATPEKLKSRARAHGSLMGLVIRELVTKVKFPNYNVPAITAKTESQIEEAADTCRNVWKLGFGPITHIGRVAERNGVVLVQHLQHTDKIDAFARRGTYSMIVLNTARNSTSRWIYDVAHELGHFTLHGGIETGSKETEAQANYFASALLLPRRTFPREFTSRPLSWTHIFDLKKRWHISAAAIIRRAYNLTLLDPITYRRCYQQMSLWGWLKREPHEPDFDGPEWLPSAFDLAAKRFEMSPPVLCNRLQFSPELFTAITGISIETAKPVRFKPRLAGSA